MGVAELSMIFRSIKVVNILPSLGEVNLQSGNLPTRKSGLYALNENHLIPFPHLENQLRLTSES